MLIDTVDLSLREVLTAGFAVAGMVKTAAAASLAMVLLSLRDRAPPLPLLALTVIELAAATLTTHAAARLDSRGALLAVEGLHQLGAAIWIGGIPCFLLTLATVRDGVAFRLVGARFSRMSMVGVACILVSGITMSLLYIGDWHGFYGTAFGVMVGAKIALFLMLLGLGGMNFLLVERLRASPATSINRLRRFAEVEFGIGIAIFFAAASLTSVPPAVDLTQDRVTWQEIVERNTPECAPPDQPQPRRPGVAGVAGEAGRRSRRQEGQAAGGVHPRRWRTAAAQRRRHRLVGIQPPLGRADRCRRRPARVAEPRRAAVGATLAAGVPRPGGLSVLPLRSRRPGRWAISASWKASGMSRCCSTGSSCC